jgi:bifunctional non-homologous end joining protein LigD
MLTAGFVAPCLPTAAPQPPSGAAWLHEIKHDVARKIDEQVRLYSRPGNDLTDRFPLIVARKREAFPPLTAGHVHDCRHERE